MPSLQEQIDRALKKLAEKPGKHLVIKVPARPKGGKRKMPGKGVKVSSYARHWPDVKPRKKRRRAKG